MSKGRLSGSATDRHGSSLPLCRVPLQLLTDVLQATSCGMMAIHTTAFSLKNDAWTAAAVGDLSGVSFMALTSRA